MSLETLLFVTAGGLVLGALYALMATGLAVVWTTLGIFNFAHGAFLALLIGRAECRKKLSVFTAVECHDDDQLRHFLFGRDVIRHCGMMCSRQSARKSFRKAGYHPRRMVERSSERSALQIAIHRPTKDERRWSSNRSF